MEKKRCLKFFTVADFDREQEWLNDMSRKGWDFIGTNGFVFTFGKGAAGRYLYKVDIEDENRNQTEYEEFMKECGIEIVGRFKSWIYLRKLASDGAFEQVGDKTAQLKIVNRAYDFAVSMLCLLLRIFSVVSVLGFIGAVALPEGNASDFMHGFAMSVSVTGLLAVTLIFTPIVGKLQRRQNKLLQDSVIGQ